ncbi:hypothetical protein [Paracoccus tegillarcae]|uniref:hypothetical protein n=1 Tax=Paracoccus tegillarcae TaxID=1529068 RepID=UPI0013002D80|nr:hypothetical protein [Paracoccus tegillarcae]
MEDDLLILGNVKTEGPCFLYSGDLKATRIVNPREYFEGNEAPKPRPRLLSLYPLKGVRNDYSFPHSSQRHYL